MVNAVHDAHSLRPNVVDTIRYLATTGHDHKTPICPSFDQRFDRYSQPSPSARFDARCAGDTTSLPRPNVADTLPAALVQLPRLGCNTPLRTSFCQVHSRCDQTLLTRFDTRCFQVHDIVATTAAALEPAVRKGVTVAVEVPEDSVCYCDLDRFRHVVYIVLANAVKYTKRGHVRVRSCSHVTDVEGISSQTRNSLTTDTHSQPGPRLRLCEPPAWRPALCSRAARENEGVYRCRRFLRCCRRPRPSRSAQPRAGDI